MRSVIVLMVMAPCLAWAQAPTLEPRARVDARERMNFPSAFIPPSARNKPCRAEERNNDQVRAELGYVTGSTVGPLITCLDQHGRALLPYVKDFPPVDLPFEPAPASTDATR